MAWGREPLLRALQRATTYRRFTAAGVRAIVEAGPGVPTVPTATSRGPVGLHAGGSGGSTQLALDLPLVPERPLSTYALEALTPLLSPVPIAAPTPLPRVQGASTVPATPAGARP